MKRINLLMLSLIFVFTQNTAFAVTADSSVNTENTVSNIETSNIIREVRKPTRDKYWEKLHLDTSAHPEILRYKIQWFSGGWSDWYTKGKDDLDWKTNYDGTKRRVWSYFTDHTHEVEFIGNNNYLPDLTVEDIKFVERIIIIAKKKREKVETIPEAEKEIVFQCKDSEFISTTLTKKQEEEAKKYVPAINSYYYSQLSKKGTTTFGKVSATDYCLPDGRLTEFYCSPNEKNRTIKSKYPYEVFNFRGKHSTKDKDFFPMFATTRKCPFGCRDGACITEEDASIVSVEEYQDENVVSVEEYANVVSPMDFVKSNRLYVYAKIKNQGKKESDNFTVKIDYYKNKYDFKIQKYKGLIAGAYLNVGDQKNWVLLDVLKLKESPNNLTVKVTVDYGDEVLEFKENNNSKVFNNSSQNQPINTIEQEEENICPVLKQIKCPSSSPKLVKSYDSNACIILKCAPISKYYELKQRIKKIKYRPGKREKDIVRKEKNLVKTIDKGLTSRLKGKILLQTENNGEAWYVDSDTEKKFYLQDGKSAHAALQAFGLGISKVDLEKISKVDSNERGDKELTDRLKGKILLDVENKGEAWYVDPVSRKRHYMRNGEEAYKIMRNLSLGITNSDLAKISTGSLEE